MSQIERDPRAGSKPPFGAQEQSLPGSDETSPRPPTTARRLSGNRQTEDLGAVVTGGDSGIGRAVALAFAREGADVLISYLEEDDDAAETARLVEDAGRRAVQVRGDLADPNHCEHVISTAASEFGRLDLLVNNAAVQTVHESFEEITDEEVERVFRTNIFPLFTLCRAAMPLMGAGSAIINTTSIQAYDPAPPLLHYASTKGAIVTFTKGLSKELIKRGIRVNAVAPGPVWTPLIAATMPGDEVSTFGETNPTGRPAQPADLAPAYVFLASAESRFMTGEVIGVTGGRLLP